jgi:hypothetical protein
MRIYGWIVAVFVSATVALLWTFGATLRTLLDVVVVVLSLVPAIVRATPALYLRWIKARFWAANTPATWELSARFQQFASDADVDSVAACVQRRSPQSTVLASTQGRTVIRLRRFVVDISEPVVLSNAAQDEPEIFIAIAPVTIGYRDSKRFLERELLPLIEAVRDDVGARWAAYALRVDLPEQNPYVGLYLQSFRSAPIQEFRIQFALPATTATKIVVAKERVTVMSDTIEQFRQAVSAALAFRVPTA